MGEGRGVGGGLGLGGGRSTGGGLGLGGDRSRGGGRGSGGGRVRGGSLGDGGGRVRGGGLERGGGRGRGGGLAIGGGLGRGGGLGLGVALGCGGGRARGGGLGTGGGRGGTALRCGENRTEGADPCVSGPVAEAAGIEDSTSPSTRLPLVLPTVRILLLLLSGPCRAAWACPAPVPNFAPGCAAAALRRVSDTSSKKMMKSVSYASGGFNIIFIVSPRLPECLGR